MTLTGFLIIILIGGCIFGIWQAIVNKKWSNIFFLAIALVGGIIFLWTFSFYINMFWAEITPHYNEQGQVQKNVTRDAYSNVDYYTSKDVKFNPILNKVAKPLSSIYNDAVIAANAGQPTEKMIYTVKKDSTVWTQIPTDEKCTVSIEYTGKLKGEYEVKTYRNDGFDDPTEYEILTCQLGGLPRVFYTYSKYIEVRPVKKMSEDIKIGVRYSLYHAKDW